VQLQPQQSRLQAQSQSSRSRTQAQALVAAVAVAGTDAGLPVHMYPRVPPALPPRAAPPPSIRALPPTGRHGDGCNDVDGDGDSMRSRGGTEPELARSPVRALYPASNGAYGASSCAGARAPRPSTATVSATAAAAKNSGSGSGIGSGPVARPGWPVKLMDWGDAEGLDARYAAGGVGGGGRGVGGSTVAVAARK